MSTYVPELLNELTRIIVTTMNHNPSVEAYDTEVLPRWKQCQAIQARVEQDKRAPTLQETVEVMQGVIRMLRAKQVPETELRERIDEALARARSGGLYAFDEARLRAELG